MNDERSIPKTIRLNSNVISKVKKMAKSQNRTFSNMVETILKNAKNEVNV